MQTPPRLRLTSRAGLRRTLAPVLASALLAACSAGDESGGVCGDLLLTDEHGKALLFLEGFHVRPIRHDEMHKMLSHSQSSDLYRLQWRDVAADDLPPQYVVLAGDDQETHTLLQAEVAGCSRTLLAATPVWFAAALDSEDRIADALLALQDVESVWEIEYGAGISYKDVLLRSEIEGALSCEHTHI